MRNFGWRLSLLGLFCASHLFASPCGNDTLANYILLGAGGCTINGVLVNDFNFAVVATNLGSPLTTGAIMVAPTFTASKYQLLFTATGMTTSTGFTVAGSTCGSPPTSSCFAKYEIDFNWDPLVSGAGDDLDDPPVFPGTATVTTKLCNGLAWGPTCSGSPTNTLTVFDDGHAADAIPSATTSLIPPVCLSGPPLCGPTGVIGAMSVVDLEANGASSTIAGFDTWVATPEPGTLLLLTAGILGLTWRRLLHCVRRRQPTL